MKNLKKELFDFKKELKFEESEISSIVESHFNALDKFSEKRVIESLNGALNKYKYHEEVKGLLESLNTDVSGYELLYNLKDLFKVVESRDNGAIYRQPLNVILDIINTGDESDRMAKIVNELAIYSWVPEIKLFMHNLTNNPQEKQNLLSGGKADSVYTIVESVEGGHVAYISESWFLLSEDKIEKIVLEDHVKDGATLSLLRTLETGLKYSDITNERVNFKISENIIVGLSVDAPGETFINEDKLNKETTLDNLFKSPIIPIVNKNFFPIIKEMAENLDKIVELDVVKQVSNLTTPYKDVYAFNYKNNMYLYNVDARRGNTFYKYESASELIDDVRNELNYDLTYFYENKVGEEVKVRKRLEDKVREIQVEIDDLDRNIDKVKANITMIGESEVLSSALTALEKSKDEKNVELTAVKETLYNEITKA